MDITAHKRKEKQNRQHHLKNPQILGNIMSSRGPIVSICIGSRNHSNTFSRGPSSIFKRERREKEMWIFFYLQSSQAFSSGETKIKLEIYESISLQIPLPRSGKKIGRKRLILVQIHKAFHRILTF